MNTEPFPVNTEPQEKENAMADLQKRVAPQKSTHSDAPSPPAQPGCFQPSTSQGKVARSRYTPIEAVKTFVEKLLDMLRKKRQFMFLLIGRTGVGNSSIINSLMGEKVAPTDDYEPATATVEEYKFEHAGQNFVVIDPPGLCDALPGLKRDDKYMREIASKLISKTCDVDCVLYVPPLTKRAAERMKNTP